MTGGFLQLVAKSFDDLYLTISPQVTLFKVVYRRYANFSLYDDDILIKSGGNFSSKTIIKLDKKADLLHKMYVVAELPQVKTSKKKPTFEFIQKLLAQYNIAWNYSAFGLANDIVTTNAYDSSGGPTSITETINNRIDFLIENYNFFNNGSIMANDGTSADSTGAIATSILNPLTRLKDSSGSFLIMSKPTAYNDIKNTLINGRNCATELLYRMASSYSPDYGNSQQPILGAQLLNSNLSTQNLTYKTPKTLSLYQPSTQVDLLTNGILLGALKAYAKDATIYNANYTYNNSGFITSGYLPDITASGTGIFYKNVMYKVSITGATITGTYISGGILSGTFVDPAMSASSSTISGVNIINATISTVDGAIYTNYSILNCTLTSVTTSTVAISNATITAGTLTSSTISGITITNAVFDKPIISGGTVSAGNPSSNISNDGNILLPLATIIDSAGIKKIKTLYNCTFAGGTISSGTPVNRAITSGTEAYIVITDAQLTSPIFAGSSIIGGTIKNGIMVENNITIPIKVANAVLVNAAVKTTEKRTVSVIVNGRRKFRTVTVVVTTLYNISHASLNNISISGGKVSAATISSGIVHTTNSIPKATINGATYNTRTLTGGTVSGGTMYNYAIQDIGIDTGILPSAFLTNATLIDTSGLIFSVVELDNLNLSYPSNITNVTVTGNTTNPVHIPDVSINSYDNTRSSPLFGNILSRPAIYTNTTGTSTIYLNNSPAIVRFPLYNSDDFRYITYMTYLNNITRIKISSTGLLDPFNPTYSTVLKGNLSISSQNLNILTPQLLSLDESILFYHVIDPAITKYNAYSYNLGQSTLSYFNDIINNTYVIINKYNQVIPVSRDLYTLTDAYMIYLQYMATISTDPINNVVTSSSQVQYIANLLTANIDINVKYNFLQLYQILSILYYGNRYLAQSYITSFYKQFTYSTTTGKYTSVSGFTPIIGNSTGIDDNFLSVLNNVTPIQYSGINVTNFFNNYVYTQFQSFKSSCVDYLTSNGYSEYYDDYNLWATNLYQSGNNLMTIYSLATGNQHLPTSTTYGKISVSSYIPFVAARDIPQMVYDTFVTYADYIFQPYIIDVSGNAMSVTDPNYTNFRDNSFLSEFKKYTDGNNRIGQSNGDVAYTTKLAIYQQIIRSTFIEDNFYDATTKTNITQFVNDSYFSALQTQKAKGSNYLLSFTLRPEKLLYPSSRAYSDGTLRNLNLAGTDFNWTTNLDEIVYLPIEWLTQTYYNILGDLSDKIIDTKSTYTITGSGSRVSLFESGSVDTTYNAYTLKQHLRGILANIVNCFMATSTLPSLSDYQHNRYSLLGLLPETNSVLNDFTKSAIINTTVSAPIYCDAISSITYQTQKKFIQLYNQLFNDVLLSKNYYKTNLGTAMTSLYDYISTQFILAFPTNINYDTVTKYPNRTPGTLSFANDFNGYMDSSGYIENLTTYPIENWKTELYPAVDSINGKVGFDVYRLTNITSTMTTINTFINDFTTLYTFMLAQYNQNKTILQIKNDAANLTINGVFPDGSPDYSNTTVLQKSEFIYGQSQTMNNYIYSNVYSKYIYPLTSASLKATLGTLALNTMNYWIPQFDSSGSLTNNGLLGPLDMLYGTLNTAGGPFPYDSSGNIDYSGNTIMFPSGNIPFELKKLATIPAGKTADDYIDLSSIANNPFKSFFLHDWYLSLKTTNNITMDSSGNFITYQTLIDAVDTFDSLIGSTDNQLITSNLLTQNPYISTLYTSALGTVFGDASVIANMMFDNIFRTLLTNITNGSFQVGAIASQISMSSSNNGYNQTLIAFRSTFSKILPGMLIELSRLTKLKNPSIITDTYFGNRQYIDITKTKSPSDVYFYYSSNPSDLINTELETILLTAIEFKPAKFAWVNELGNKLIKNVSIKIGGQIIDSHSSELLHFINKIYRNANHSRGYDIMIGNTKELSNYSDIQRLQNKLYIPLHFWFNKHAGNALPLLCLLYSDVELIIEMSSYSEVLIIEPDSYYTKIPKLKTKLFAQYIFLDEEDRHRLSQSKLEYLIESYNYSGSKIYSSKNLLSKVDAQILSKNKDYTVQDISKDKQLTPAVKYNIYLNDPIKYLVWYARIIDKTTQRPLDMLDWNKFGYRARDPNGNVGIIDSSGNLSELTTIFSSISIQMNGSNREDPKNEDYYTHVVPYGRSIPSLDSGEYFYSFALYPTLLQPSGSANYSELTDSSITMILTDDVLKLLQMYPTIELQVELWGCANKILRVMSGFGALAFYK